MSRIIAIIKRDFLHVRGNAIALLVCMGLAIMPSFYAWFNIAGGWDPYGNTSQVKVALANSDEGVKGSIVPFNVNVGEQVVTSLTGSKKIGYVVTSEDEAIDGVRSGEYYAAVVIPKNFSSNLLSVLTKTPTHPQLDYYVNEKRNPIASIVTGKASGSVQNMIDTGFTEAATEVATDLFGEMSSLLVLGLSLWRGIHIAFGIRPPAPVGRRRTAIQRRRDHGKRGRFVGDRCRRELRPRRPRRHRQRL